MMRGVPRLACHPQWSSILAELPNLVPLAGYIVPVRGVDRNMAIECGYALSRILTLYQDRFCRSVQEEDHDQHGVQTVPHQHLGSVDAISTLLVVVDAVQVVLEKLAAKRSNKSRRRLIVALETIKVALKLACLFQTRQMLLDRGRMVTDEYCTDNPKYRRHYYQGKRSGVRFATPQNILNAAECKRWLMFGEILHIVRPALYAQLMSKRGWGPILISLIVDLWSRACTCQAMKSQYQEAGWVPSPREVEELRIRKMQWMFYVLRNPIFSCTTDPVAKCIVDQVKWIPLANRASSWAYELLKYYSAHHFYTSAS